MKLITNKTSSENITQFIASEYNDAFSYIEGKEIKELTRNIKIITKGILQLADQYSIEPQTDDFKNKLFQKLNKSNNLSHVGISNIVYNIVSGTRDCNNCEIVTQYKALRKKATIDGLTRLINRSEIESKIHDYINIKNKHGTDSCLLVLDIDYFKRINDQYGHDKGDQVLKKVADIFNKNTRPSDIVGRWGGEEFVIILPYTNMVDGEIAANKIREAIKNNLSNDVGGIEDITTISIGLTALRPDDSTGNHAFKRADRALYDAKAQGRNKVCTNIKNPGE